MRRRFYRLLSLGLSLLFAGCSLTPTALLDPNIQQQIEPTAEITDTPFIQQADFQCGPASLAMVMNYYGDDITPQMLARQVFTPKAKGSFPVEMDIASRRQGYISFPVNTIDNLIREINAGHPVLVLQNLSISWYPMWHFAVVVGYDLQQRELVLRSGDLARRITPMSVFENTWARSDHWGRVVLPPTQIPVTADPLSYIQIINSLEQVGQLDLAITAYRTATVAWPESHLPRFALANILLATGKTEAAIAEYHQLLTKNPKLIPGWNNFAYALKARGCFLQAQQAAQCGVQLAPQDANLLDTSTEMSELPPQSDSICPVVSCSLAKNK